MLIFSVFSVVSAVDVVELTLNINAEHMEALNDSMPTIIIEDTGGNAVNSTVTHVGNGTYLANFTSNCTNFTVNISVLAHHSENVSITTTNLNGTNVGNASVSLDAYNLVIITGSGSFSSHFVNSYKELKEDGYYYNIYFFSSTDLCSGEYPEMEELAENASKIADVLAIEMIGTSKDKVMEIIENGTKENILAIRCGETFSEYDYIDSNDTVTEQYFVNPCVENIKRFQLHCLNYSGMDLKDGEDLSIVILPTEYAVHSESNEIFETFEEYILWYETRDEYNESAPWVGILSYDTRYKNDQLEMEEAMLEGIESKGYNVVLVCSGSKDSRVMAIEEFFLNEDNSSKIDVLVANYGFTTYTGFPEIGIELYETLNVPILTPVYATDLEAWNESAQGLNSEVAWEIAQPELEGRIEPMMIGGVKNGYVDEETGIMINSYVPLESGIEQLSDRVQKWVELRTTPNEDKKIAILYYNHAGGKDGVGASYLNVEQSIYEILTAMSNSGYTVSGNYTPDAIVNLTQSKGLNVGGWAPGELEELVKNGAITIPVSDYEEWFSELPEELQEAVIAEWGEVPGNVMVYNDSIVIPGEFFGNIFVGPQPMRGWGEDPTKITHSADLPPSHQYIAFYMWLQHENGYDADAVVHLGTHGTLEWLPGKSAGLGETCWPNNVLGNLPNINPYIVENTGEGTQAKRRGYAVIIDHQTSPMIPSGLYGNLSDLKTLINDYDLSTNSTRQAVLEEQIKELISELNLDSDLELDLETADFEEVADSVEHYLEEISSTLMPYGLHTFGISPNGTALTDTADAIVSFNLDDRNNTDFIVSITENISTNYEMENFLNALDGRFIPPEIGGCMIRNPDVLPTGYNFYSFDPRYVPDQAAWEIGSQMADDLIESYYNETGEYPEQVGVVLWSTETMRTNGQSIAMILRLVGAEPVWKSGKFIGITVTPIEELGRPRIDVLVSTSGLFRDSFSYILELLDDAFIEVMMNDTESTEDNYLKKHYLENYWEYIDGGMSEENADFYASARIFGPEEGTYGTGVSALVPTTSAWDDQEDLIETYLERMSYIYGNGRYAVDGKDAFIDQLSQIDATVQVRDGLYGLLDNDDVYQYLGGLTMAAEAYSGNDVLTYIANTRTNDAKIETLQSFLANEFRTRIENPTWIEGMLSEGSSGALEITSEIEHLFGWEAVDPDSVQDWMWEDVAETFIMDENIRAQMLEANPYAYNSLTAWMLESARREMWTPTDEVLEFLANEYVQSTVDYGVTCCHHTCGNLEFTDWTVSQSSLDDSTMSEFIETYETSTHDEVTIQRESSSKDSSSEPDSYSRVYSGEEVVDNENPSNTSVKSNSTITEDAASSVGSDGRSSTNSGSAASTTVDSSTQSKSQKAYEVTMDNNSETSETSGTTILAILGAIGLTGLIGFGYVRQDPKFSKFLRRK
ncbi:cobaltochelatase subunit CobN [Methanococcus sp. CF]